MKTTISVLGFWSLSLVAILAQTPPFVIAQPQSAAVVVVGSNLTLSVNAAGSPAPSFQWQINNTNINGDILPILSLTNVTEDQSGIYDVVVTNEYGSVTSSVARITVITPTIYWTGAGDGQSWNDSSNWNTGVLPNSSDSIFIGGSGTITNVPSDLTLNNLICQQAISFTGSLTVTGAADVVSILYLAPTISLTVNGTNSSFIGESSTTADGVSMYAGLGALISFPGLTSINGDYNIGSTTIQAGPGAVVNLSSVQYIQGPADPYGSGLNVYAEAGAVVNLSDVTNISGSFPGSAFYATATNSVIDLSSLLTFTHTGLLEAANGGIIWATNLNYVEGVSLYLDDSYSTLALTGLTNIIDGFNDGNIAIQAGPGAVFNLSSVRFMTGDSVQGQVVTVTAGAGALVNLSGVTNITGNAGNVAFYATATNSVINLNSLLTFNEGGFSPTNGGTILATNLSYISGVGLYVDAYSTLELPSLNRIDCGTVATYIEAAPGAVLNLSSVRMMTGSGVQGQALNIRADAGALVNLSGVTNITGNAGLITFYAIATNSAINLNSLLTFNEGGLNPLNGGTILATNLSYISGVGFTVDSYSTLAIPSLNSIASGTFLGGNTDIEATPGTVLNLSSVRIINGQFGSSLNVEADAGALVNLSGVTNIIGGEPGVNFYATATNGEIDLSSLLTFTHVGYMEAANGGIIWATNLNYIDGVSLYLDDGCSTLALTGLTNIINAYNDGGSTIQAGPGAVLNLSSAQNMQGGYAGGLNVYSDAGALVNLSGVTNIVGSEPGVNFYATTTNSVIDLCGLLTFTHEGYMEAANGGIIWATNLNYVEGVSLYLDDSYSTLALNGLTDIIDGYNIGSSTIQAGPGAMLNLSSVQYMQGPDDPFGGSLNVYADAGALVNLSGVTNIFGDTGLAFNTENGGAILATNLRYVTGNFTALADGTNSVLNFSGAPHLVFGSGSNIQFTAQNSGLITFNLLQSISGGGASFLANGAGSVIDLSSLSSFTTPLSTSGVIAENGGVILFNSNPFILQNVAINWAGNAILPPVIAAGSFITLYSQPWDSYWVEALDTRNAANQWWFYERVPATNGVQVIGGRPQSWEAFQVYEFVANPPIMDLNRLGSTNMQLVLYAAPSNSFDIQTTYSLDPQLVDWSLYAITGAMTNSFRIFAPFAPTNTEQFYLLDKE